MCYEWDGYLENMNIGPLLHHTYMAEPIENSNSKILFAYTWIRPFHLTKFHGICSRISVIHIFSSFMLKYFLKYFAFQHFEIDLKESIEN